MSKQRNDEEKKNKNRIEVVKVGEFGLPHIDICLKKKNIFFFFFKEIER